YIYLAVAILNIIFSIPLCKYLSGIGCAIGTAAALIIGNGIIMNIFYHKKCNINMIYFWKNILKAVPSFLPPIITGILLTKVLNINILLHLIIGIVIYSAVYIISIWLFGMNTYERNLLKAPINKFVKKCGVGNK
ncbi:MAG TPA: polysaccharide biosynthesis protein, partial [Ruminococcaceae bacterium]|nr:polysaccharide biosynthesis protein [Oscillospiraceae bacterium]